MATIKDAEQIRFQHRPKIFGRSFFDSFEDADAGVVDEDVEAAELFYGVVNQSFDLTVIPHIAGEPDRPCAGRSIQILYRLIYLILISS